jgi:hypothetical protein
MTFAFDPSIGAIVVPAELTGPSGTIRLSLLLDTGANTTVIGELSMSMAGFDPSAPHASIPMTTASATGKAGLFVAPVFSSLGVTRSNMPILCHDLPADAGVDGLLGCDFFETHVLTIDFRNHTVEVS